MYSEVEITISRQYLTDICGNMGEDMCLLGGWAVHSLVTEGYREYTGREYIGSKDIDLGFHLEQHWDERQLRESAIITTKELLERDYGFIKSGIFRYEKWFDSQSGDELTEEEAKTKPMYDTFILYIDFLVDNFPTHMQQTLGFHPLDEPLLQHAFDTPARMRSTDILGVNVNLPDVPILLAMKLTALPRRKEQEKRVKDLSDSYALTRFSDFDFEEITSELHSILDLRNINR